MSKKLFSDSEVKLLSKSKYVTRISNKAITYSFEFKKRFVEEYNKGKLQRVILRKLASLLKYKE